MLKKVLVKKWKTLRSEKAFSHHWYCVQKDHVKTDRGKILDDYFFGVFENIVLIVAITPQDEIILVRQYKHGARRILLEIPGGYIDKSETPLKAAKRELQEETGYSALAWRRLGFYYQNPTKERGNGVHLFLASHATQKSRQQFDHGENIEIKRMKRMEVLKAVRQNNIKVGASALALLLALS